MTLTSLHAAIGVVPQDPHLFHDTIRANLLFSRPTATENDLIEACRAAQVWDAISALPDRLDTLVGERGYRLSGGEKQRICLARLLLKAPPVVILDEATAHLDSESEAAVQRALDTAPAGRTSLVIAHRLSTVRQADQILVVNEGRICERGTHNELLVLNGMYANLYRRQFAESTDAADGSLLDFPYPDRPALITLSDVVPVASPELLPHANGQGRVLTGHGIDLPADGQFLGEAWAWMPAEPAWGGLYGLLGARFAFRRAVRPRRHASARRDRRPGMTQ